MNTIRTALASIALASSIGAALAGNSHLVAIAPDVTLDRSSIAAFDGAHSVWVNRNYGEVITLGNDTQTGAPIYPHQSVDIQYVVDCVSGRLSLAAWKMFSEPDAKGDLVWSDRVEDTQYRYAPGTDEERGVVSQLCGSSVASR